MSDKAYVLLLHFGPAVVAGGAACLAAYLNHRKIEVLHGSLNGRMDKLVELTKAVAYAAGYKNGTEHKKV